MNAEKRDQIRGTDVIFFTKFRRVTTTFGVYKYVHVEYMILWFNPKWVVPRYNGLVLPIQERAAFGTFRDQAMVDY